MKIKILHLIEGAKCAKGIAVIIDVFRAFSFEAYAFHNGVEKILPVATSEECFDMKNNNPSLILAGEINGKIIEGFDYGNSPSEIEKINFKGKTIVHRTSAGTQGLVNAFNADEILTGSLVNAKAIANYIRRKNPKYVSLVCMGLGAKAQTEEDNLCAEYIKSLLENTEIDMPTEIKKLKTTSGAKFFDPKQKDVFPQKDFDFCTKLNIFDFVLKAGKVNGQLTVKRHCT